MKFGKHKWSTLVWYITPSIHIHSSYSSLGPTSDEEGNNTSITIAWFRSSLFLYWKSNIHIKRTYFIPTLMYRDTYFNQLTVSWFKRYLIIFNKRNNPPQWDKKIR